MASPESAPPTPPSDSDSGAPASGNPTSGSTPPASTPPSPPASPPPNQSPPPASPPPSSPPPSSPPPSSPPPSSPPPSSPPPQNSSPPKDSPPPSPTPSPPVDSKSPPPSSPPPESLPPPFTTVSPPPPDSVVPPTNGSQTLPVFAPPPPDTISIPTPPSPAGNVIPPPSSSGSSLPPPRPPRSPSTTSDSSSSSPSDSTTNSIIIAGIVAGGVLVLALVIVCILCTKKKKKQAYYIDAGRPPKPGDPYYGSTPAQWNSQQPVDHIVKLPPPPGVLGTPSPLGGGGAWGAPPPLHAANTSSEFSSGYSGQHHAPPSPNMGGMGGGLGFSKSQFTYEVLAAATGGFSQVNLLGQGGFGYVHKGVLTDGRQVAVKSLKSGSGQGEREFQAEVEIISRVHHRHLVSLVGYCITEGQRMLVYEYVSNKTLEFHLHGKDRPVMDWAARLRIALGSAKGLSYLHEDCHPRIIHRDIKAANILLDDKYEAMVADFGLAKLSSDNYTHVSTRVMGTFGYLAPEYASSGKLTEKSDVFSFGVMLLELITGRKPVDPTGKFMEDSLVDWARPLMTKALEDGNYDEVVDPRLEGNYVAHEMARMISCASASIRHSARRRPKMSQIVRALEGDSSLEDLNDGPKTANSGSGSAGISETQTYDTGMYNADMMKFRKMVMSSQEFASSEYGGTSEYGLNPSASSSEDYGNPGQRRKKP